MIQNWLNRNVVGWAKLVYVALDLKNSLAYPGIGDVGSIPTPSTFSFNNTN